MVEPTSDHAEDADPADAPVCATCDAPIPHSPDHRVITWVEDDVVRAVHFCDERCRRRWEGD